MLVGELLSLILLVWMCCFSMWCELRLVLVSILCRCFLSCGLFLLWVVCLRVSMDFCGVVMCVIF